MSATYSSLRRSFQILKYLLTKVANAVLMRVNKPVVCIILLILVYNRWKTSPINLRYVKNRRNRRLVKAARLEHMVRPITSRSSSRPCICRVATCRA